MFISLKVHCDLITICEHLGLLFILANVSSHCTFCVLILYLVDFSMLDPNIWLRTLLLPRVRCGWM